MYSDEIKRLVSRLEQIGRELTHLQATYSAEAVQDRSDQFKILTHLQYIVSLAGVIGMHIAGDLKAEDTKT